MVREKPPPRGYALRLDGTRYLVNGGTSQCSGNNPTLTALTDPLAVASRSHSAHQRHDLPRLDARHALANAASAATRLCLAAECRAGWPSMWVDPVGAWDDHPTLHTAALQCARGLVGSPRY
jgi:hypothetical protein